jgi:hypothetical protein
VNSTNPQPFRLLRSQLILSLCDYTGAWSQPYEDDGYEVVRVDVQHGQDVRLLELPDKPVHGILAAPPCTMFANSGARWERTTEQMLDALSVVDACCRIILMARPQWWVLENPAGKLSRYLGPPALTFQPNHYGDPYTKFTCLWGNFTAPRKSPVPATEGSKMHRLAPSAERQMLRSVTPTGFAQAFFEANP